MIAMGEDKWKDRAANIEHRICERAAKAAKGGRIFRLKPSEEKALEAIGVRPGPLMNQCYNQNVSRRRIVSQRLAAAPF